MDSIKVTSCVVIDSSNIVIKRLRDSNWTNERTTLV
jgi:hypothetical protein